MSSNLLRSVSSQPKKYTLLIELKFLFLMIKIILVICVYLTYDENIFSGLSLVDERDNDKYNQARATLLSAISFFAILAIGELFITLSGYTYNFNKNNILIVSLNIFAIYLLGYFIFDAWHYVTIWYIFIVAEFPQAVMEGYGFFSAVGQQLFRYNKMRQLTIDKSK
jgi:hypothetical protein